MRSDVRIEIVLIKSSIVLRFLLIAEFICRKVFLIDFGVIFIFLLFRLGQSNPFVDGCIYYEVHNVFTTGKQIPDDLCHPGATAMIQVASHDTQQFGIFALFDGIVQHMLIIDYIGVNIVNRVDETVVLRTLLIVSERIPFINIGNIIFRTVIFGSFILIVVSGARGRRVTFRCIRIILTADMQLAVLIVEELAPAVGRTHKEVIETLVILHQIREDGFLAIPLD